MKQEKIKTMEELASVSGISRPTLSKYFQDPASVRQSTRTRIEEALGTYEYQPNMYAINQNRQLTRTIGIVVPVLSDPFFAEIARSVETCVIEAGYRPFLLSSHGDADMEIENLRSLRALKPTGALIAPLGRRSHKADVAQFCEDVPTVLFDSNIEGLGDAYVGSNNDQSIDLMVEYLCDTGEPPVFFEMLDPSNPNARKRRTAYSAAMERLGHSPEMMRIDGDGWNFEQIGYDGASKLIGQNKLRGRTVLCSNDRLAIGFLAAAFEAGLKVGRAEGSDLRVAGHDNHPFAAFTCPSLTTISQDYASIAAKSLATLLAHIEEPETHTARDTTLFPGHLIVRNSG